MAENQPINKYVLTSGLAVIAATLIYTFASGNSEGD
jgi:hypothetical protein